MNKQKFLHTIVLLIFLAATVFAFSPAAAAAGSGGSQEATVTLTLYGVTISTDSTVAGAGYTVATTADPTPVQVFDAEYTAVVGKNGQVLINVNTLPEGYKLKVSSQDAAFKQEGRSVRVEKVTKDVFVHLKAEKPYIPPSPSGGGSRQQGSSVWLPATPTGLITADITLQYSAVQFIAVSAADIASLRTINTQYAASLEEKLLTAEKAGIRLTNNRGARAIVQSNADLPDISKVSFSRVYDIKPANPNEKVTQVTVTVPKVDIVTLGLTTDDVTIYHYLAEYDIWVPLDTLQITEDFINYYYTAATDGASPFGVLIMKFEAETDMPSVPVESAATPTPLMSVLAGLGTAAVLFGLRRK